MGQVIIFVLAIAIWVISLIVKASKKKTVYPQATQEDSTSEFWQEEGAASKVPEQAFWEQVRAERVANSKHRTDVQAEANTTSNTEASHSHTSDFNFNLKDAVLYSEIMNPKFEENDNI